MPTRRAWDDNSYEGKIIRSGISKLAKALKKSENTEETIKILNAISTAANSKMSLSKYESQDKKLDHVLEILKSRELKQYNHEALNDIRQLPGQQD